MEPQDFIEAAQFLLKYAREQMGQGGSGTAGGASKKLGFCEPPARKTYLYIDDEEGFYEFDENKPKKEQKQYKEEKAILCLIKGVKIGTKVYESKTNSKVRIGLYTEERLWVLEKGLETNFTKDLLNCLALLGADIKKPVTIEISIPPDQEKKTCFCKVYNHLDMEVSYDRKATSYEPHKLIDQINSNLGLKS